MNEDLAETGRPDTRLDAAASAIALPGHQPHDGTRHHHQSSGRDAAQQVWTKHAAEEPKGADAAAEEPSHTTPLTTQPTPKRPQSAAPTMTPSATQATPHHDDAAGTRNLTPLRPRTRRPCLLYPAKSHNRGRWAPSPSQNCRRSASFALNVSLKSATEGSKTPNEARIRNIRFETTLQCQNWKTRHVVFVSKFRKAPNIHQHPLCFTTFR